MGPRKVSQLIAAGKGLLSLAVILCLLLPAQLCYKFRPEVCTIVPSRLYFKEAYAALETQEWLRGSYVQLVVMLVAVVQIAVSGMQLHLCSTHHSVLVKPYMCLLNSGVTCCVSGVVWTFALAAEALFMHTWTPAFFGMPHYVLPPTWLMACLAMFGNCVLCVVSLVYAARTTSSSSSSSSIKSSNSSCVV